jgi:hypothetical protein
MILMAEHVGAQQTATVTKISAVRGRDLEKAEPGAGSAEGDQADAAYWVVRGTGTFLGRRGQSGDHLSGTGYIVIEDATGDIVGMGMP